MTHEIEILQAVDGALFVVVEGMAFPQENYAAALAFVESITPAHNVDFPEVFEDISEELQSLVEIANSMR